MTLAVSSACGGELTQPESGTGAPCESGGAQPSGARPAPAPYVPPAPLPPVMPVDGELASGLEGPARLAVDAANVYFTATYTSATGQRVSGLMACSKAGCGSTPTLLANVRLPSGGVVSDGAEVFWTGTDETGRGLIMACAAAGCGDSPRVVATLEGFDSPFAIAIAGDTLYWTTLFGFIQRCSKDCRSPETLVRDEDRANRGTGLVWGLAVAGSNLYWSVDGASVVDGNPRDAVRTCSLNGPCVPRTLASGLNGARRIAVSNDTLAFVSDGESKVRRCTLPACDDPKPLPFDGQVGLAIADGRIYWSTGSLTRGIKSAALDGSAVTQIDEGTAATDLATDATHLFWIVTDVPDSRGGAPGTGKIMSKRR